MIRPSIDARDTVSDVVRAYPHTAVVFKTFGIDTYWDGAASLDFAARRHNVHIDALLAALHAVAAQRPENPTGGA
jgi:iron-sulfur cluster repair protein YtfE (RIC family)